MDWFLYDRDIRHEKVNCYRILPDSYWNPRNRVVLFSLVEHPMGFEPASTYLVRSALTHFRHSHLNHCDHYSPLSRSKKKKKNSTENIHIRNRERSQNPVKHLEWNFLWKYLAAESH